MQFLPILTEDEGGDSLNLILSVQFSILGQINVDFQQTPFPFGFLFLLGSEGGNGPAWSTPIRIKIQNVAALTMLVEIASALYLS
jgi:hypothetical protein